MKKQYMQPATQSFKLSAGYPLALSLNGSTIEVDKDDTTNSAFSNRGSWNAENWSEGEE